MTGRIASGFRNLLGALSLVLCFGTAAPVVAESVPETIEKHESLYASASRHALFEGRRPSDEPLLEPFCPRATEAPAPRMLPGSPDPRPARAGPAGRLPLRC